MNLKLSSVLFLDNSFSIKQRWPYYSKSTSHNIYMYRFKKCLIQLSLPFRRICTDCLKHRTHGSNIVVWLRKDSSVGYSHQFRFWSQMSILYTGKYYHALYMLSLDLETYLSDLLYKNITTIDIDNDANEIWSICST